MTKKSRRIDTSQPLELKIALALSIGAAASKTAYAAWLAADEELATRCKAERSPRPMERPHD